MEIITLVKAPEEFCHITTCIVESVRAVTKYMQQQQQQWAYLLLSYIYIRVAMCPVGSSNSSSSTSSSTTTTTSSCAHWMRRPYFCSLLESSSSSPVLRPITMCNKTFGRMTHTLRSVTKMRSTSSTKHPKPNQNTRRTRGDTKATRTHLRSILGARQLGYWEELSLHHRPHAAVV